MGKAYAYVRTRFALLESKAETCVFSPRLPLNKHRFQLAHFAAGQSSYLVVNEFCLVHADRFSRATESHYLSLGF
jgi:hypothetical protein